MPAAAMISGRAHYDTVIRAVCDAELSVWIATADVKSLMVEDGRRRYRSMLDVFDQLARRDVELRLLHAKLPSRPFREEFDRHPRLVQGGLQLRMCPRNHMKLVIVDARLLYLGSANWTGAGLGVRGDSRRNFEVGVVTEDAAMIDQAQALFDDVWRGKPCKRCGLRDVCESPLDLEAPISRASTG